MFFTYLSNKWLNEHERLSIVLFFSDNIYGCIFRKFSLRDSTL